MKKLSWSTFIRGASLRRDVDEIKTLFVRYVKEETVQPAKEMVRYAAFGALGSLFVGLGTVLLLLAVLRFLQEQFGVLNGNLSWLPYFIVAVLAALVIAVTIWRIVSGAGKRRLKAKS